MNLFSNIKDTISTICGVVIAICTALAGVIGNVGVHLPSWVTTSCIVAGAIAAAIIGVMTGKNPNLTTKTPSQVTTINTEAANTQPPKTV